ncbi:hypothetical protein [Rhodococcus sp. USK13]|nr:hypothetical protein [Rhodococcus sp. USK13]
MFRPVAVEGLLAALSDEVAVSAWMAAGVWRPSPLWRCSVA